MGGALGALGSTLVGVGVVPQLGGTPNKTLTVIATVGFIISAAGKFFTALFAADAKAVADLSAKVDLNTNAVMTGDTSLLTKAQVAPTPPKP